MLWTRDSMDCIYLGQKYGRPLVSPEHYYYSALATEHLGRDMMCGLLWEICESSCFGPWTSLFTAWGSAWTVSGTFQVVILSLPWLRCDQGPQRQGFVRITRIFTLFDNSTCNTDRSIWSVGEYDKTCISTLTNGGNVIREVRGEKKHFTVSSSFFHSFSAIHHGRSTRRSVYQIGASVIHIQAVILADYDVVSGWDVSRLLNSSDDNKGLQ